MLINKLCKFKIIIKKLNRMRYQTIKAKLLNRQEYNAKKK